MELAENKTCKLRPSFITTVKNTKNRKREKVTLLSLVSQTTDIQGFNLHLKYSTGGAVFELRKVPLKKKKLASSLLNT